MTMYRFAELFNRQSGADSRCRLGDQLRCMFTDGMRADLASFFLPAYCGLYFLAIYLISHYRIDRDTHNENLETLGQKA